MMDNGRNIVFAQRIFAEAPRVGQEAFLDAQRPPLLSVVGGYRGGAKLRLYPIGFSQGSCIRSVVARVEARWSRRPGLRSGTVIVEALTISPPPPATYSNKGSLKRFSSRAAARWRRGAAGRANGWPPGGCQKPGFFVSHMLSLSRSFSHSIIFALSIAIYLSIYLSIFLSLSILLLVLVVICCRSWGSRADVWTRAIGRTPGQVRRSNVRPPDPRSGLASPSSIFHLSISSRSGR